MYIIRMMRHKRRNISPAVKEAYRYSGNRGCEVSEIRITEQVQFLTPSCAMGSVFTALPTISLKRHIHEMKESSMTAATVAQLEINRMDSFAITPIACHPGYMSHLGLIQQPDLESPSC
jgi:hypothetical protein